MWKIIQPGTGLINSHFGNSEVLGYLDIHTGKPAEITNYRRSLDLDQGLAKVSYVKDGVTFQREVFSSAAEQVIVVRLTADQVGPLCLLR